MTLTLMTIPESTDDWPQWLDRQLVGLELGNLVAELQLVTSTGPDESPGLTDIITQDQCEALLQAGSSVMTMEQFRCLFGNPRVLLELQALVLEDGGPYWETVTRSETILDQSNRVFDSLKLSDPPTSRLVNVTPQSQRSGQWKWIASTVAVLLIAVTIWQSRSGQETPWGLSNPALVSADVGSAQEWFNSVAAAGGEWKDRDLSDEDKLLSSIGDVSDACQVLIDNPHAILTDSERSWFVQKCQNWKTKLDVTATDLRSGALSFEDARTQANGIMAKLVDVLNAGPSVEDLQALAA